MATDRDSTLDGDQITDRTIKQLELDLTNTPTNGQFFQINMPTGDFTAVDLGNVADIVTMQTNIVLNAFRIAINGSLTQFNMVDGIVDEYEDENSVDLPNSANELYDSVNDLYSPNIELLSAPFAHFKCNDNAGNTTVVDTGTGLNNGTASVNTSTLSTTGKINEAFDFNGSTHNINIDGIVSSITSDTQGSISLWVNIDVFNRTSFSIGDTDAESSLQITGGGTSPNGLIRIFFTNSGTITWAINHTGSLSTGTWVHVVLVQDGTSPKLYVDSVDVTNLTTTVDVTQWFSDISAVDNARIGCNNNNSFGNHSFFDGRVDDVRYYSGIVLSQEDVDLLYNSGSGTETEQPGSGTPNMTLISDPFTAEAIPSNARIVLFEEDVDSVTLNTDLKAFASRDAGQTFTTDFATDDKLDITSHGFANDDRIMVTSSSQDLPAGLDSGTVYYVINQTTNDFELSLTSGGSAVDITDNGTGTHTAKQVAEITLANDGEYETGKNILTGSADISGQPSGTSMEYQLTTLNNKDLKIHGTGLAWD